MEQSSPKSGRKSTALILLAVILFAGGILAAFLHFFNHRNDDLLYQERQSQMREVTVQLFSGLEDVIDGKWNTARTQARTLTRAKPATQQELVTDIGYLDDVADMASQKTYVFAVDSQGYYYTAQGRQGMLTERTYLVDAPERISFVSNALSGGTTRMNFLYRIDEDVPLTENNGSTKVAYAGISIDLSAFSPYLECDAYGANNSTYILDKDGYKLFINSKYNLLQGYNIFAVLREMKYLHGSDFDSTLQTLERTGTAFSNAVLDGTEYYYALRRMDGAEWTLLFLIPSEYVAVNTVTLMDSSNQMILMFAIQMVAITGIAIFVVLRIQQQHEVAAEVRSRQIVEKANNELRKSNEKLEQVNDALQKAQEATKEALQAAEAASKAKTDFLSNMSHDIRTPMNAIIGITTLMKSEPDLSEKMRDYLSKLESSGEHLLELINNVLDMNRIESGKTTLHADSINLAEQVMQVETMIEAQAEQKQQHVTLVTTHLNHEYVLADASRLQQILVNILSNAVKYTARGGHILFELEELPRNDRYAKYKFIVQDDGMGMSPEFLQHIFDPFSREENSVTNQIQGTGLGMAITKNVVDLMGGVIHVDSTLGKGSRFEVTLEFPIDTAAEQNMQHLSLLLVQYGKNNEKRIQDAVQSKPFQVHSLPSVAEALENLHSASYDVILMPRHIPEEDVRKLRKAAGETTILLGCEESQNAENAVPAEMDGVLSYPFFLSNLEAEVARIRERRKSAEMQEDVSPLRGMKFLCAEDNELNAEILELLLENKGATCKIYKNGQEIVNAFAAVKPGDYDMILMDVQMPVMNGLDATRAIRSGPNPLGRTIPIVAMTANAFLEDMQQSRDAGMDEHLSKPVDMAVLEQTVRRFRSTPPAVNDGTVRYSRKQSGSLLRSFSKEKR